MLDLDKIRKFFSTRDHYAKLSNIELLELSEGYAKAEMIIQKSHLNGVNTCHGGAIFTLADYAFAAAANTHGRKSVSIHASISFVRPAMEGKLIAEAKEVSLNYKIGTYTVHVTDEKNHLIAIFQGTAYRKTEPVDASVTHPLIGN